MVRNLVIAVIVLAVAFALVRGKIRKSEEERWQREDAEYQKSAEIAKQKNQDLDRQMEQRFMSMVNCETAMRNRQVLQEASASGGRVVSFRDGKALTAAEVRTAQGETEHYIGQNCKKP